MAQGRKMGYMPSSELQTMFGKRVRKLREKQGLSQMQLAVKARVHINTIALIELGRRGVSLATIEQLARALGVAPAELFSHSKAEK